MTTNDTLLHLFDPRGISRQELELAA